MKHELVWLKLSEVDLEHLRLAVEEDGIDADGCEQTIR
jgi:hypothetical protein